MKLELAKNIAQRFLNELKPHCEKVMIGGSIRRKNPFVKDIEIICIPKTFIPEEKNLFEERILGLKRPIKRFCDVVNKYPSEKGKPTGKYVQILHPKGIKIDLFIADPTNYGLIAMIRTGPADYSKHIMTRLHKQGFKSDGGYLIDKETGEIIECYREIDFYDKTGIRYLKPIDR